MHEPHARAVGPLLQRRGDDPGSSRSVTREQKPTHAALWVHEVRSEIDRLPRVEQLRRQARLGGKFGAALQLVPSRNALRDLQPADSVEPGLAVGVQVLVDLRAALGQLRQDRRLAEQPHEPRSVPGRADQPPGWATLNDGHLDAVDSTQFGSDRRAGHTSAYDEDTSVHPSIQHAAHRPVTSGLRSTYGTTRLAAAIRTTFGHSVR